MISVGKAGGGVVRGNAAGTPICALSCAMTHPAPIPSRCALAMPDPDNRAGPLNGRPRSCASFPPCTRSPKPRSVGMSRQSAYRLRSRLKGGAFDLVGEVAFHHSYDVLAHVALERVLNRGGSAGVLPGEQVGSYRRFGERLTVALLQWSTAGGGPRAGAARSPASWKGSAVWHHPRSRTRKLSRRCAMSRQIAKGDAV